MIPKLTILGPPRTKKTSNRVFRMGVRFKIMPSAAAVAWESDAVAQLCRQWRSFAIEVPVRVAALVYRDANRGDLTGYLQAIGDALQGGGGRKGRIPCVLTDDSQIESWDGSRKLIDRKRPRVEITIEPMDENKEI